MNSMDMESASDCHDISDCRTMMRGKINVLAHSEMKRHSAVAKPFSCAHCRRSFQSARTLNRHVNALHANSKVTRKSDVQCPLCSTRMYKLLIYDHFQVDHGINLEYKKRQFDSLELFETWKSNFEKETISRFVLYATNHLSDGSVKRTYNCQRSGTPKIKPLEKRVQKLRGRGSAKVNGFCPARITIHANREGEEVNVDVCATHIGHKNELGCVDLRFEDRATLASMIAEGLTFEEILERIRDSISSSDLERIHLTTRKDLHNIAKEFKLTKRDTITRIKDNFGFKLDDLSIKSVRNRSPQEPLTIISHLDDCTVVFDADQMSYEVDGSATLPTEAGLSKHASDSEKSPYPSSPQQGINSFVNDEIVLNVNGSDVTSQADVEPELMKVIEDGCVLLIVNKNNGVQ